MASLAHTIVETMGRFARYRGREAVVTRFDHRDGDIGVAVTAGGGEIDLKESLCSLECSADGG